jgi:hypothetical protein
MAAIIKHRNVFKWPKLLYFKPESAMTETNLEEDHPRIISAKFG